MKFSTIFLTLCLVILTAGCQSDAYYKEKAVESARNYIFENARELTPEQYGFVKSTPPVFLCGPVLAPMRRHAVSGTVENSEIIQICITWQIPGTKHDYLVFGLSGPRMTHWKPLRLIRRTVKPASPGLSAALAEARSYAVSALIEQMSKKELNHVRFSNPELVESKFLLNASSTNPPRPWSRVNAAEKNRNGKTQYSLVWHLSENKAAVFTGVGGKDLDGWTILFAGVLSNEELLKSTVKKIRNAENYLFPENAAAK